MLYFLFSIWHVLSLCSTSSCCAFIAANVRYVYFFLLVPFVFFVFRDFGGDISLTLITSMVLYQWPRNKIKPQKTPISEILFLMFCIGPCTLTLSPGPQNKHNPKPPTPENRSGLLYNALNHVLKGLFLQCFSNINRICPQNRPSTKTITLHNAQNKTWCFGNGLLWQMKTFMLTKKHTPEKTNKQNIRKGIWKTNKTGNPPKTERIDEKMPFKCNIWFCFFCETKSTERRQEIAANKQGRRKNKKQGRKKNKKTRKKKERERASDEEKWKKPRRTSARQRRTNHQTDPFAGEKQSFPKRSEKTHQKLRRLKDNCPKTHVQCGVAPNPKKRANKRENT